MNRRNFAQMTGLGAIAGARSRASQAAGKGRMKVGTQLYPGIRGTPSAYKDEDLQMLAALGVNHICATLPVTVNAEWTLESLSKMKEKVNSFGIEVEHVVVPVSYSFPNVLLGKSPERDREIDTACETIRVLSKVGVPVFHYHLALLGVLRSGVSPGRAGVPYSTFIYEQAKQDPPLTAAGPVSEELYWERITYFLKRVVPVAEQYKTKLACHPQDPAMPKEKGFRGVKPVLGSVAGLKQFIEICPSRYHGLQFCQGSVAEMLEDPGKEIYDVIRYFGSRGKIFGVHFRNLKGKFLNFQEPYIDDGDVDMLKAARAYMEMGYDGMLMPDHVPRAPADRSGHLGYVFAFGYIKALIHAVYSS